MSDNEKINKFKELIFADHFLKDFDLKFIGDKNYTDFLGEKYKMCFSNQKRGFDIFLGIPKNKKYPLRHSVLFSIKKI
jgi:hypothetical protein